MSLECFERVDAAFLFCNNRLGLIVMLNFMNHFKFLLNIPVSFLLDLRFFDLTFAYAASRHGGLLSIDLLFQLLFLFFVNLFLRGKSDCWFFFWALTRCELIGVFVFLWQTFLLLLIFLQIRDPFLNFLTTNFLSYFRFAFFFCLGRIIETTFLLNLLIFLKIRNHINNHRTLTPTNLSQYIL